jgi:hypothetical protein
VTDESAAADTTAPPSSRGVPEGVAVLAIIGLGFALLGFIAGIVLMAEHIPGTCHRDAYDYGCTIHPHGSEGVAISAISLSVGVLILLVAYASTALLRASNDAD